MIDHFEMELPEGTKHKGSEDPEAIDVAERYHMGTL
jgi:hypothetical protein